MTVLVIRLSAMGDVAISVPVLYALSEQYPEVQIYMLTNRFFNPLFSEIRNLELINPNFDNEHKNIFGLFKLYKKLKKDINPDIVIDIHDVLRTKFIRFLFQVSRVKTAKINKGRPEKRKLTRKKNKIFKPLKNSIFRYNETFEKAGILLKLNQYPKLKFNITDKHLTGLLEKSPKKIGIAPFAKHLQKQYPLEKTEELIKKLSAENFKIFIFGGGEKEKQFSEKLEKTYPNTFSVIGKYNFQTEIALIDRLDLMITPDSGNMHLAALTSVKIISIWGATHPFAGFTPYLPDNQHTIIQNNNLDCRPCSVFGNKKCYKNTIECLHSIEPKQIYDLCKKITD